MTAETTDRAELGPRRRIATRLWALSLALLAFVLAAAALGTAAIAVGYATPPILLAGALVVAAAAGAWVLPGAGDSIARTVTAGVVLAILVVGLVAATASVQARVYDVSFDGRWYHLPAIELLAGGWNPWHDVAAPVPSSARVQLTHFPKGSWIVGAGLYRLTGQIESAKAINGLLLLAAYAAAAAAFLGLKRLPTSAAWALATVAAAGPIAVTQLPTTLVDGAIGSLWVCGMAALIAHRAGSPLRGPAAVLVAACALLPLVKFTGLAAVVFLLLPLAAAWLVRWQRSRRGRSADTEEDSRRGLRQTLLAGALACAVSVLTVGSNPYVTNWLHYGHPLAPRPAEGFGPYTAWMEPPSFLGLPPVAKTLVSLFARSGHTQMFEGQDAELKPPFTLDRSEIGVFRQVVNPRIGGFGPLFSGALLLGLAGFAVRARPSWATRVTWIALSLTASVLLAPVGWIARFVPQLWLVPVLGAAILLATRNRWRLILGWAAILALAVDLLLVTVPRYQDFRARDRATRQQLTALARSGGIVVYIPRWIYGRLRLAEAGVDFTEVTSRAALPCADPRVLSGSQDSLYCAAPHLDGDGATAPEPGERPAP